MDTTSDTRTGAPPDRNPARVRIGPAGWSYRDWEGIVYPNRPGRDFDPLRHLSQWFDLIEVNVSFYRVPSPKVSASWVERSSDRDLQFSVKLPSAFTHGRQPASESALTPFREFVDPLAEAGRLGEILVQFPWSWRPADETLDRLRAIREALAPQTAVFELRHGAWARPPWNEALARLDLAIAGIDQPAVGDAIAPGTGRGRGAYLRLHGRNARSWFDRSAGRDQRYDYLYSIDELREWVGRIERVANERSHVQVVTNNHFEGQAVINALELRALLGWPTPTVPAGILRHRPELLERWETIGWRPRPDADDRPEDPPAQGELFG